MRVSQSSLITNYRRQQGCNGSVCEGTLPCLPSSCRLGTEGFRSPRAGALLYLSLLTELGRIGYMAFSRLIFFFFLFLFFNLNFLNFIYNKARAVYMRSITRPTLCWPRIFEPISENISYGLSLKSADPGLN